MFDVRRVAGIAVAVALAIPLAVGCSKKEDKPKAPSIGGGQQQGTTVTPQAGGGQTGTASVAGKVTLKGAAPKLAAIKMSADAYCAKAHAGAVPAEEVIANADGTLQNVLVYVKSGISGTYPAATASATVDQNGCLYIPHIQGVQAGQPIDILNSDDTLHNIQATPATNQSFNKAMPTKGGKETVTFDQPEDTPVKLKCQVHPWMTAYIGVFNHPFFSVTGKDGSFNIKNLPAGTYTITVWHEKYGASEQQVTVTDGQAATADFSLGG